jgi:hypothetical protein
MKVLEDKTRDAWPIQRVCASEACHSTLLIDLEDLEYSRWKVSGYHFAGTAVIEGKYTFECGACGLVANGNEVDEALIPLNHQQRLQREYRARR